MAGVRLGRARARDRVREGVDAGDVSIFDGGSDEDGGHLRLRPVGWLERLPEREGQLPEDAVYLIGGYIDPGGVLVENRCHFAAFQRPYRRVLLAGSVVEEAARGA